MTSPRKKISPLAIFILLSLAMHLIGGSATVFFGSFDLRAPIKPLQVISATIESPAIPSAIQGNKRTCGQKALNKALLPSESADNRKPDYTAKPVKVENGMDGNQTTEVPPPALRENPQNTKITERLTPADNQSTAQDAEYSSVPLPTPKEMSQGPVRKGGEFVPSAREKLTYRIMLYKIPAGTAVLEATNKNGEVRITTRVASNEVFSAMYPVEIFVDTRLMVGNYLLTRIRQHEGNSTSDTGFTLMLREKNAFWVDRLKMCYANIPLRSNDVMDMISGFYYLRNQRLEVGKSVVLHLFDSSKYTETAVEVLRKEHLRLPGFREADTLVVHPILTTDGFFHTSGDIFIWLTDDEKKVPVKMEAQIPLGKVSAELVAAESEKSAQADSHGVAVK
jgi:hypothetical protein